MTKTYDVRKMVQLYRELGTYTAVAKAIGCSSSTASKYIKQYMEAEKEKVEISEYCGPNPGLPNKERLLKFYEFTIDEINDINEMRESGL